MAERENRDQRTEIRRADGVEPWMRGTHEELDVLRRAVIHALELAEEDVATWCSELSEEEMFRRLDELAPVAFHLRHMARSLDRLLTYAEDRVLDAGQLAALKTELEDGGSAAEVLREFRAAMARGKERVRGLVPKSYAEARGIGRKRLPTTVGGILIHCAEHTQRHVGQAITTVKAVTRRKEQR